VDDPEERQIMEFVTRSKIERFKRLLRLTTDVSLRTTLSEMLAREEAGLLEIRPGRTMAAVSIAT
jgi:hypothetical protein